MKPLVYYGIKEIDEGTLSVSKKLFDEILDEVYAAGFADGKKNSSITSNNYIHRNGSTDGGSSITYLNNAINTTHCKNDNAKLFND